MSPVANWIDEARRLLAEGFKAQAIAKRVGVSADSVRVHLNINGAGDRYRAKLERYRIEGKNNTVRRAVSRDAHVIAPTPLLAPKVSVPFVSILAGIEQRSYSMVQA